VAIAFGGQQIGSDIAQGYAVLLISRYCPQIIEILVFSGFRDTF
jgi:hypothetical protein